MTAVNEYINRQTLVDLKKQLSANGYKSIGKGVDAIVFAKKDSPDVVKYLIGDRDRETNIAAGGFLAFAEFCKTVKSPHLPKFSEIKTIKIGNEEIYQVSMERLHKLTEDELDVAWTMARYAENNGTFEDVVKDIEETGSKALPQYQDQVVRQRTIHLKILNKNKSVFVLMQQLAKHAGSIKGLSLDLIHETGYNIMRRRDGTWVIIDPFVL